MRVESVYASMVKGGLVFTLTCFTLSFIEKGFIVPAVLFLIVTIVGSIKLTKEISRSTPVANCYNCKHRDECIKIGKSTKGKMKIKFIKLHKDAIVPTKAYKNDAGYDVYACEDIYLPSGIITPVPIGLAISLLNKYYGEFASRSSLRKKGIWPPGNVLDANYRGPLEVLLFNSTHQDYLINKGDRIAQIILRPTYELDFEQVKKLPTSERGEKGFGSSGQ